MRVLFRTLLAAAVIAGIASCAGDSGSPSELQLTTAGELGWQLAREKGCAACHGTNGQGNVGPAFAGLYGSTVELQDGTTVVADDDYLIRSIKDPNADKVKGYNLPMPTNNLSDTEIASILDYLRDMAGGG
ncbi:MAG TPA: cytochrome c [Ilumatobacter sp.]|nr:cytochrome c [Ilumatobacter sp.]